MNPNEQYKPPEVWAFDEEISGNRVDNNRPIAGPTFEQALAIGDEPLQLYSLGTPNGIKITVMLEELLALGKTDANYDLHLIDIRKGEEFGSGFTALNPNSKIPALMDHSASPVIPVFESASILHYLAEKFDALLPKSPADRAACMNWLFWQGGSTPLLGGGFGHFYKLAPYPMAYPINRFAIEAKRQYDVLDRHLAEHEYMCDSGYSIADIAIWPWYGRMALNEVYAGSAKFLDTQSYKHVMRWTQMIGEREAVQKGVAKHPPLAALPKSDK